MSSIHPKITGIQDNWSFVFADGLKLNAVVSIHPIIIDTHVEPEQFMAGFGMTKAWFYKGQLSTSSVYHGDDSVVDRIVTSISQCDKF